VLGIVKVLQSDLVLGNSQSDRTVRLSSVLAKFGIDLTIVDYCFLLYFFLFTVHTVFPLHDLCN